MDQLTPEEKMWLDASAFKAKGIIATRYSLPEDFVGNEASRTQEFWTPVKEEFRLLIIRIHQSEESKQQFLNVLRDESMYAEAINNFDD